MNNEQTTEVKEVSNDLAPRKHVLAFTILGLVVIIGALVFITLNTRFSSLIPVEQKLQLGMMVREKSLIAKISQAKSDGQNMEDELAFIRENLKKFNQNDVNCGDKYDFCVSVKTHNPKKYIGMIADKLSDMSDDHPYELRVSIKKYDSQK